MNYETIDIDNNIYEPFKFKVYLNFFQKELLNQESMKKKIKNKNYSFYETFLDNILKSIYKLENKKIFIKISNNFIFIESQIFFSFFKKKNETGILAFNQIFSFFITEFLTGLELKDFNVSMLNKVLRKFYIFLNKNKIFEWKEFKKLFYDIFTNDKISRLKSIEILYRFLTQFSNEEEKIEKEEDKNMIFKLDNKFAVPFNDQEVSKESSVYNEESLIFKLFGTTSFFILFFTNFVIFIIFV